MIDSTPWTDADEDAIGLDDDALIGACLGLEKGGQKNGGTRLLPDWPPASSRDCVVRIDPDIAAWFRQQSPTWKQDISRVLRAWMTAQPPQARAATGGMDSDLPPNF